MSWHGPSAPRVEGMATKSPVAASCPSKLASTASRILRFLSLVFMASRVPSSLSESQGSPYTPANPASHGAMDARQPQYSVSDHRRADRGGGRAGLQSVPDQEGT